jgi:hypothetical protein
MRWARRDAGSYCTPSGAGKRASAARASPPDLPDELLEPRGESVGRAPALDASKIDPLGEGNADRDVEALTVAPVIEGGQPGHDMSRSPRV